MFPALLDLAYIDTVLSDVKQHGNDTVPYASLGRNIATSLISENIIPIVASPFVLLLASKVATAKQFAGKVYVPINATPSSVSMTSV